jgi:uncharacterized protein YggE
MKISLWAASALLLLSSCHSSIQPQIQVTGQATMKVVPDMVEFTLKAYNVRPAMKDAVSQTLADIDQILQVCRKYVPSEDDIKVSNISTDKDYNYDHGGARFDGYSAQQSLQVNLRNLKQIEPFMEGLMATKINSIESIRYTHSKADSIQREVNLLALSDARKTAEKMCGQLNVALGRVIYLSNYGSSNRGISGSEDVAEGDYSMHMENKSFGGRGFKMTAPILEFEDQAFAGFEIKN